MAAPAPDPPGNLATKPDLSPDPWSLILIQPSLQDFTGLPSQGIPNIGMPVQVGLHSLDRSLLRFIELVAVLIAAKSETQGYLAGPELRTKSVASDRGLGGSSDRSSSTI